MCFTALFSKNRVTIAIFLSLGIGLAAPIPGDIDGDGHVGFSDFLILAQNFNKEGDPFAPGRTASDTVRVTISDTIKVAVLDTIQISVVDTVRVSLTDTVIVTIRDTSLVNVVVTEKGLTLPNGETVSPVTSSNEISIASFNIRIFSTGSRDDSELELIADRLQQFDLIAIQELRDVEVLDRTRAILSSRGHSYSTLISQPLGASRTICFYVAAQQNHES